MKLHTIFAAISLFFIHDALGTQFLSTKKFELNETETLRDEWWVTASEVHLHGTAENDVFMLSASNRITGTLRQDLWVLAEHVEVSGTVNDDLRGLARSAALRGHVGGDLMILGDTVQLADRSRIRGDVALLGAHVITRGTIDGSARMVAKRLTVGGTIAGSLRVVADTLTVMGNTTIGGDLEYTSPKELILDETVQVGGDVIRTEEVPAQLPYHRVLWMQGFLFLSALAVGTPFAAIFPRLTGRTVRLIRRSPWKCGLAGLVTFCLLPLLSLLACLTVIGIPLGVLLAIGFIAALYLSKIFVGLTVGGILLRRGGPQPFSRVFVALVVGLLALYLLTLFPLAGTLIWLAIAFFGMGGLLLGLLGTEQQVRLPAD